MFFSHLENISGFKVSFIFMYKIPLIDKLDPSIGDTNECFGVEVCKHS